MKTRKPLTVDLSIDMDFFSRELPAWDWGHSELGENANFYRYSLWPFRYEQIDLYNETDPAVHADFLPLWPLLLEGLNQKNVEFKQGREGWFGFADSHEFAYSFFLSRNPRLLKRSQAYREPPNVLINIDAHHDCFGSSPKLHCGNWLRLYEQEAPNTRLVQLYPKWKPLGDDAAPNTQKLEMYHWADWPGLDQPHRIRHIFLCRSSVWLPPHHDEAFVDIVQGFAGLFGHSRVVEMEPVYDRAKYTPTREQAAESFKNRMAKWEALRAATASSE